MDRHVIKGRNRAISFGLRPLAVALSKVGDIDLIHMVLALLVDPEIAVVEQALYQVMQAMHFTIGRQQASYELN